MPCRATDAKHARRMFHEIIFPRFGTPCMVISNGGSHFIDKTFRAFLKELGSKHNIATPYHLKQAGRPRPQTNRSKISYRKWSMTWGKAVRISFLMHSGVMPGFSKKTKHSLYMCLGSPHTITE
jgi:hypothetical protein